MSINQELIDYLGHLTILYVEDDPAARSAVEGYLELLFEEIFVAEDGNEALKMYHNNDIDLILTDIDMPGLNGIEMAKKIRETDKEIPIIIMTAHTKTDYLLDAVELHLEKYIVKPFVGDDFLKVLEKLFVGKRTEMVVCKGVLYDQSNKELKIEKERVGLTRKESALLELLLSHKNRLVGYDEIESAVWESYDEVMSSDSLRALVKALRKKLPQGIVQNVSGMGYKLVSP